jgi:hypothetical protein
MSEQERTESAREQRRGEHNEIGFRIVDEQGDYDEQGSQTPGPGEPPSDEGERAD